MCVCCGRGGGISGTQPVLAKSHSEAHMMISTSSEQQGQWMAGTSRGRGEWNKNQKTGQKREIGLELLIFHIQI